MRRCTDKLRWWAGGRSLEAPPPHFESRRHMYTYTAHVGVFLHICTHMYTPNVYAKPSRRGARCPYVVRECMHLYSLLCIFGRKRGLETLSTRGFRPLNPHSQESTSSRTQILASHSRAEWQATSRRRPDRTEEGGLPWVSLTERSTLAAPVTLSLSLLLSLRGFSG